MVEGTAWGRGAISVVLALTLAVAVGGCLGIGDDDDAAPDAAPLERAASAVRGVTGPLCEALPAGNQPGAPRQLRGETADVALQWIPVVTTFEAAIRAAGVDIARRDDITILAPTDDAFAATITQETVDALIVSRRDELRALLEAHILEGAHSLADLRAADKATTRAGEEVELAPAGAMARIDDRGQTVCADYVTANAMIHVIDGVLGPLPKAAPPAGPIH
jgi:uncharacterized surface protein with fasciclin (FAS1) repeats